MSLPLKYFISLIRLLFFFSEPLPGSFKIANLVLKKVKGELGFDRCKFFMSGAAPVMKESLEFFYGLHIPLAEVYGMSECTG